jgi:hypothetical protein
VVEVPEDTDEETIDPLEAEAAKKAELEAELSALDTLTKVLDSYVLRMTPSTGPPTSDHQAA